MAERLAVGQATLFMAIQRDEQVRRTRFKASLMLGAMVLMTATGTGVLAQGIRIDQMPGAYNRDEVPDRAQPENNGYPPGVVATPPKGTIIDPPQGNAAGRAATATSRARVTPATTGSGIPTADEIASVYARAFTIGMNGTYRWIGGNTVIAVQPMMNLEMGRYEYRVAPSSVSCTKTKAPGHRCKYTVSQVAVRGQGLSGMTAAFSGAVPPTVVTRTDQFERRSDGLVSSSLTRTFSGGAPASSTDEQRRRAEQDERTRQSMEADQRRTLGCDNPYNPWGPPPGC